MAEQIEARELVRAIGAEFDRHGWSDPDDLALAITKAAVTVEKLDSDTASELAAPSFLEANGIDRGDLRDAVHRVFAGRVLVDEARPGPTFVDQSVTIGDNNTISGAINTGGNQLVLTNNTPASEVLSALGSFVGSAIENGFAAREVELLGQVAESRGLSQEQLEEAVRAGIEAAAPAPGPLAKFRDTVAAGATTNLVVQAIVAAAGALL
jgi:hypothetical protein